MGEATHARHSRARGNPFDFSHSSSPLVHKNPSGLSGLGSFS